MGAGASKQAGKAAAAAGRRQYPSSPSVLNSATSTSNAPSYTNSPTSTNSPPSSARVHPKLADAPPTDAKDHHVELDARDPDFGSALRKLGPAIPVEKAAPHQSAFPTSSQPPLGQQGKNIFPSSSPSSNPSLMIVQARERIAKKFEEETDSLGRPSFPGRTLISAKDLKEVLRLRDQAGIPVQEIEKQMRLQPGVLTRLARPGVYANV